MLPWWQNFWIRTVTTDDCNTQEKLETMVKNLCKILGGKQGENGE